jgi:4-amino-4-deoxy-L-arabinose transferase-like glycosyltransferase
VWVLVLATAAYLLFDFATLDRIPLTYGDESWFMEPAWQFDQTGRFGSEMYSGLMGLNESNVVYGRIFLLLHAAAFHVLGLGLWQARIVESLVGFVVVWLVYALGTALYDKRVGAIAGGGLLLSYPFLIQSHTARPEMLMVAFILGGLVVMIRAQDTGRTGLYLLAGLLSGLAVDVHLTALPLLVLPALLALSRSGIRSVDARAVTAWSVGVLAAGAWWLAVHVAPDPQLFWSQWTDVWSENQMAGFARSAVDQLAHPIGLIKLELQRYVHPLQHGFIGASQGVFLLLVAMLCSLSLLLRNGRSDADRTALTLLIAVPMVLAFTATNKTAVYAFLPMPFLSIVIARAIERWREIGGGRGWAVALGAFVMVQLVASGALAATNPDRDPYTQAAHTAEAYLEPGGVVMGDPVFWFGLHDHPYASQWGQYLAGSLPKWVAMRETDYAILDADDSPADPQGMYYSIRDRMHLVTEIRVGAHHDVRARLYKIDEEPGS